MRLLIIAFLLAVFIYPNPALAEIATTKDWIGLFDPDVGGYRKQDTLPNCPGLTDLISNTNGRCWVYTSSTAITCDRTPGSVPRLDRTTDPCTFTLNPPLSATDGCKSYVFRLMANDTETLDSVIATKDASYGCQGTPAPINGKLYYIANGDLTINSDIVVNETGVIFVEGNLYINTNLLALSSTGTPDPKKGIVFVVKGTININRGVETVNAFLISFGKDASNNDILPSPFCSAWDPIDGCADFSDSQSGSRKPLTINGSVISLNTANRPFFVRKYAVSGSEAEKLNFEPKYLVIMKDIFSRDLKIWREIQ